MTQIPDRTMLAPGLEISRLVTGLWQIADMERDGRKLDLDLLARDMAAYAEAGFDTFDMADHYGSAEDHRRPFQRTSRAASERRGSLHQMVPEARADDAAMSCAPPSTRAQERLQTSKIDLMQFHWWTFQHPGWIDAHEGAWRASRKKARSAISAPPISTPIICACCINHGIPHRIQPGLLLAARSPRRGQR